MGSLDDRNHSQKATGTECGSAYIDWYSEGEARTVEVDGVQVIVRFVGRKGRRGRIVIEAPPGAVFSTAEKQALSKLTSDSEDDCKVR